MKAMSSRIMTCEKPAPNVSSTPAVTAFWPKYGSMTVAVRLKRSFRPASMGRKVLTSPPEPTFKISIPMMAFSVPPSTSYHFFFRRI